MLLKRHGGVTEDAYVEDINLAYKLEDGMKIHIITKIEKEKQTINKVEDTKTEEMTEKYITTFSGVSGEDTMEDVQSTKININAATQTQLETLPGVGPSTATKIITYRKENGKFKTIEDIKQVSGIGESKFEKIKNYITVK